MPLPDDWQNPITAKVGDIQRDVDPVALRPSRRDLLSVRLAGQVQLLQNNQPRWTPITVTPEAVIFDGHHAIRAAAEGGLLVEVTIIDAEVAPVGLSILELPVR
jgi:hypothetical protein